MTWQEQQQEYLATPLYDRWYAGLTPSQQWALRHTPGGMACGVNHLKSFGVVSDPQGTIERSNEDCPVSQPAVACF